MAGPACLIGNPRQLFELAVAVAISCWPSSATALATVVGVLVEVPVMLSLVAFVNRTRHWFAPASSEAAEMAEGGARP